MNSSRRFITILGKDNRLMALFGGVVLSGISVIGLIVVCVSYL